MPPHKDNTYSNATSYSHATLKYCQTIMAVKADCKVVHTSVPICSKNRTSIIIFRSVIHHQVSVNALCCSEYYSQQMQDLTLKTMFLACFLKYLHSRNSQCWSLTEKRSLFNLTIIVFSKSQKKIMSKSQCRYEI